MPWESVVAFYQLANQQYEGTGKEGGNTFPDLVSQRKLWPPQRPTSH